MDNQEILCDFINKIGVETFVLYLNMIFNDDTGDMNLAIMECINDDLSYM